MFAVPPLGRLRQQDCHFKDSLGYIAKFRASQATE